MTEHHRKLCYASVTKERVWSRNFPGCTCYYWIFEYWFIGSSDYWLSSVLL